VASNDGLEPSGWNWAEASSMQVSHDVLLDCEFVNVVGGWLVVGLVDKLGSSLGQGAWLQAKLPETSGGIAPSKMTWLLRMILTVLELKRASTMVAELANGKKGTVG
jgi:hypothetical protein